MFLLIVFCVGFSSIVCMEAPVVKTTSGYVSGAVVKVNNISVVQYLNIPYAEPPIGRLRFAKPVPLIKPKKGIIDGTKTGNSCLQYITIQFPTNNNNLTVSEDCLVLNVWTPTIAANKSDALKPVMFLIHGGSFLYGTSFDEPLNGSALASFGVVVVALNYRLGPFGFLYGGDERAPGNMGLYDQLLALYWVKNNIYLFGGDPKQITLNGFSAGSWSISAHLVSPLSRGVYQKAILDSGTILQNKLAPYLPKKVALSESKSFAQHFNCSGSQWLECLRGVDANRLNAFYNLSIFVVYGTEYLPLSAQEAFLKNKFVSEVDIMAGIVADEGSPLAGPDWPKVKHLHSAREFQDLVDNLSNRHARFSSQKLIDYPLTRLNSENILRLYLGNLNITNRMFLERAYFRFYSDLVMKCPTYLFAKLFAKYSPKSKVFFYFWTVVSSQVSSELGCYYNMTACHASPLPYVFGRPLITSTYDISDQNFSEYVMRLRINFAKYGNPMKGFPPNFQWPRFLRTGANNEKTLSKDINPFRLNHIIDDRFARNCEHFWKNYFI